MLFTGRLESQAPEIDGRVLINDFAGAEPQPGEFRRATVTDASDYDLVARLEAQAFAERMEGRSFSSADEATEQKLFNILPAPGTARLKPRPST